MSWVILTAVGIGGLVPHARADINVVAECDAGSVHVGETVTVRIRSIRSTDPGEVRPIHAALGIGPEWELGGQHSESEVLVGDTREKTWRFELIARQPGPTELTPMVMIAASAPPGLQTNRVLGPKLALEILPAKGPSPWPRLLAITALMAVVLAALNQISRRRLLRRAARRRTALEPLPEALATLHEVHANCREDRAARFFTDVERVLHGYLSRRLGRVLPAATGAEIVAIVARQVPDPEVIRDLTEVLDRCTKGRFSGGRIGHEALAQTETLTRSVLERLDAAWVTIKPDPATPASETT